MQINKKGNVSSLLLLNPVKGGFICYSGGVTGFMPRSQGLLSFSNILSSFNQNTMRKSIVSNLNFLIQKEHFIRKFFMIRLPHWWGKITIYPAYKKNNFSKAQIKKKRYLSNDLNFVFLSQKIVSKTIRTKNTYEN